MTEKAFQGQVIQLAKLCGHLPFGIVPGCTAVVWRPDAPPLAERWWRVETSEGADFGAIGRRLRGSA